MIETRSRRSGRRLVILAAAALAAGSASGRADPPAAAAFQFVDVAAEAGLTRITWCGRPGKDHLLDSEGTGAAFLDYDRDGRLDIFLANGWRLSESEVVERGRFQAILSQMNFPR